MDDLIARLEGATGPCPECDIELSAIGNGWTVIEHDEKNRVLGRRADGSTFVLKFIPPDTVAGLAPREGSYGGSKYTRSTDAAQQMVPEGYAWQCGCDIDLTPTARVWGHELDFNEIGATPAIALCIAALKARAEITCTAEGMNND